MLPARLKFVYRCALIVDTLLSAAIFIVLSGPVFGQWETFSRKMVEPCAICYLYLAVFVLYIAIDTAPKIIDDSFRNPFFLIVLLMLTVCGLILFMVFVVQPTPAPLLVPMVVSAVNFPLTTIILLATKGIDDNHWESPERYTALGDTPTQ
jgi:hypothetical protein